MRETSQRREVGIGLIGVGWMGRLHAAAYRRLPQHFPDCLGSPRLVIAADASAERAQSAVDHHGFERATKSAAEVIGHPDVEAVSITAPNHLHRELAIAAASAGKAIWAEKPLGRDPLETAEIAAAVAAARVPSLIGFNYRHVPAVQHARALVTGGRLGSVRTYRGRFLVDYAARADRALSWRFSRDLAGLGVLGDLMSHVVDLAHHLVGPVAEVVARDEIDVPRRPLAGGGSQFGVGDGDLGPVENEDYAVALGRFANGARAIFEVSRTMVGAHCRHGFELHGTLGAVTWDFERMNELQLYLPREDDAGDGFATVLAAPGDGAFARFQPDRGVAMGYDDLKVIEAATFLDSVVDGRQREPGAQAALAAAEVVAAMRRSSTSRSWEPCRT